MKEKIEALLIKLFYYFLGFCFLYTVNDLPFIIKGKGNITNPGVLVIGIFIGSYFLLTINRLNKKD